MRDHKELVERLRKGSYTLEELSILLPSAADAIEELSTSAQPEQQWIPCKDCLPERTRKRYWVCTDGGNQYECRWTNNRFGLGESDNWGWSVFDIPQHSKVVAWMPLPDPYEEHSMEEFMYGQDPGDPEDGRL